MANFKMDKDYMVDKNNLALSYPVGSVVIINSTIIPDGWLLCDGRPISRTTYSNLYNLITTTYGVGDGSTTFNLPPLVVNATYNTTKRTAVSRQSSEASYPASFSHTHYFYKASGINYGALDYSGTHTHASTTVNTNNADANHNHTQNAPTGVNNVTSNAATSRYSSANNAVEYHNDYVHDHGGAFTATASAINSHTETHTHTATVHGAADSITHTHTATNNTNVVVGGTTYDGISFSSTEYPLSREVYFIIKY